MQPECRCKLAETEWWPINDLIFPTFPGYIPLTSTYIFQNNVAEVNLSNIEPARMFV